MTILDSLRRVSDKRPTATVKRRARSGQRKARQANRSLVGAALGRGGLVARGLVYLALAYLTADIVAHAHARQNVSSDGAFDEIARQPGGPTLVVLLAVGFFAYAAWRFLQAAAGDQREESGEEIATRLGWAAIGVVYLVLSSSALLVALGDSSRTNEAFSFSHDILRIPGGQVILAAAGTGFVIGGIALAVWACLQRFHRYLLTREMPSWIEGSVHVVETFGNATRGLVFAGIGASFLVASVVNDPKDAKGLNGALQTIDSHPFGRVALAVAAAGFAAFGVASLFEAKYRDVEANTKKRST
jgi:Domain of Unknown Function (DUF1206)